MTRLIRNFLSFSTIAIVLVVLFSFWGPAHGLTLKMSPRFPIKDLGCQEALIFCEKKYDIPPKLLSAIAHVESGGHLYAINALGGSHYFETKQDALMFIRSLRARGVRNINIGCMQINLQFHGHKFKELGDMLEPLNNIEYAACLLRHMFDRYGSWVQAVRFYNPRSMTYQKKVFQALKKGQLN